MSSPNDIATADVMQVCRNGHVITDRLRACPETGRSHCDRCGSVTLEGCRTCGEELTGSVALPGMVPSGARQPPHYCPSCGAPFPWADRRRSLAPSFRAQLENLLRRLPLVLRQLRTRSGERPPIAVQDERDLED